jgi:hypothetical protein
MIVCYYTDDDLYSKIVRNLIKDLTNLKLNCYFEKINRIGDWNESAKYRPEFLLRMLDKFKSPLVSLDADARVYSNPILFENITTSLAMHKYGNYVWAAGTLYLKPIPKVVDILEQWKLACTVSSKRSGLILDSILKNYKDITNLPPTYCKIFDLMCEVKEPVIEHFQASRLAKRKFRN